MRSDYSTGYLSIIGYNYLIPIGTLLKNLYSLKQSNPNEVQSSPKENGYSVSLVVLNVLTLESLIRRTQYLVGKKDIRHPVDFIREEFPDCNIIWSIEELFVIRDVIVHNHVWDAQIVWDDEMIMRFNSVDRGMGG